VPRPTKQKASPVPDLGPIQMMWQLGGPDYLPVLRSELLHVIRKYVNVDVEAIQVNFERDGGHEVLELSVALPERPVVPASMPEPA